MASFEDLIAQHRTTLDVFCVNYPSDRTPKDISNGANTSEREKSVPIKSQNKRRISEVEPSEISAPSARKVQKLALPTNLLGSPISDDTDEDSSGMNVHVLSSYVAV